jgi:DNA polymerase-1
LIQEFGSIENLLSALNKISKEKERKRLEAHSEQAIMSRELAKIKCDVPLDKDWQEFELGEADQDDLINLYRELEFKKLLQELEGTQTSVEPEEIRRDYQLLTTTDGLEQILSQIRQSDKVAFTVMISDEGSFGSDLLGLALAWGPEQGCYLPLTPLSESSSASLDQSEVMKLLAPILSDPRVQKVIHNSKQAWIILNSLGVELSGLQFDTMLAAYVLDPGKRVQNLDVLAREHLNVSLLASEDLVGTGKKRRSIASVPLEQVSSYAGDQAVFALQLADILDEKIKAASQATLFNDIELPLVKVLARMEIRGVKVDVERLDLLAKGFSERLEVSAEKIHHMAGEPFNINSPQQLGQILFDKLGLPMGKKTKTGYSTSMEVLSSLSPHHPLPGEVLNYRSLMKMKNTYVDALPRMVNPDTGRIHTSYNQTATVTGRLSSSEPNLQNIPVRTEEGREIRRAFVADSGNLLISADYSQIELRILAHYSKDEALLEAFSKGEDIHLRTAAEIFGVQADEVSAEMRRQAKAINFGIIYGMSSFRLAKDLGIPQKTGREIIERYFERYQGVRSYVEEMPKIGREQGFVATLFNRKRFLPDLNSRNRNIRQFAERTAINTPIQGSAADIIKLAMIKIDAELERKALPARMIMQVHDELVLEVEGGGAQEVANLVQYEMESVASLAVPLVVEAGIGANWDEAH